jgi:hypothetical protein
MVASFMAHDHAEKTVAPDAGALTQNDVVAATMQYNQ